MDYKLEEARMRYLANVEEAARLIEDVAFDHAHDLGVTQVAELIQIAAKLDRVVNQVAVASTCPGDRSSLMKLH